MERRIVQVARARAIDAQLGDIINREPEANGSWFQLSRVDELHDGKLALSDGGVNNSFAVGPLDIVGLQLVKTVAVEEQPELDDYNQASEDMTDPQNSERDTPDVEAQREPSHA